MQVKKRRGRPRKQQNVKHIPSLIDFKNITTLGNLNIDERMLESMPTRSKTVDEFFGESDIYINQMNINIFTDNIIDDIILLSYQGCHDGKYCYPIITKKILINSLKIL